MAAPLKVIFDPESLLIDPLPGLRLSLHTAARQLGLETAGIDGKLDHVARLWDAVSALAGGQRGLTEELFERFRAHYFEHGRYRARLRSDSAALRALMKKRVDFEWIYLSHFGPRETWALLDAYPLREAVDTVICPDEMLCVGLRGALLDFYAREQRWTAASARLLSDCPAEIVAARRLQLPTLALGYGRHAQPQCLSALALNLAASPAEALRWLQAQRPLAATAAPLLLHWPQPALH